MRRPVIRIAASALLAVILAAHVPAAAADGGTEPRIFWTDANWWGTATAQVGTANTDGTDARALVPAEAGPDGVHQAGYLAVDPDGRWVYWSTQYPGTGIGRVRTDGKAEDWVVSANGAFGVAVSASRVYWTNDVAGSIVEARLDGSRATTLVTGLGVPGSYDASPHDVAVDTAGGKVYWTATALKAVQRANLDGTGLETIATSESYPMGIGLDLVHGDVYWAEGCIYRVPLAGGIPARVLCSDSSVIDVAVDGAAGELYWTEADDHARTGAIGRARLDGSGAQVLVSEGLAYPWGIAVAQVPARLPEPSRGPAAPTPPATSAALAPGRDAGVDDLLVAALLMGAVVGGSVSLARGRARTSHPE